MQRAATWATTPSEAMEDADERVVHAAQGDPTAFLLLYERHRDAVYRYLRSRTTSDEDAADLTATTFERALRAIGGYREKDGGAFRGWLFRIARNAAVDAARRRRPSAPLEALAAVTAPSGDEPERAAIANEDVLQLRRLIAALPDAQRDAIVLRFAAGLTAREIGAVIGKSEAATQKLVTRALLRLKEATGERD